MGLHFHNTLTRRLEPFESVEAGKAGVYACGPTIYGHAHIGNFRTFMFYDLVHRVLEWRGYEVRFVMNFTDVDDKTIRAARAKEMTLDEYTAPFAEAMLGESDALGIRRADLYPRATVYVDRMIDLIQRLLDRGFAYATDDGSVWYDISSFEAYGRLSGRDLEQGRPGERVAEDEYAKDDARDFALWKGVKREDEEVGAAWDAPWGRGRPGWHIECSAMALAEIGDTLDLHLGGEDLIFPHHEDEIAQSEGATGKPFSRVWLHAKHLRVEGEKMSKSAGNFVTVRELLDEGVSPAALRHLLLSAHYRSELNFTRAGLQASARAVARLLDFEARLLSHPEAPAIGDRGTGSGDAEGEAGRGIRDAADRAIEAFTAALLDDLNVAGALAALFVFVNEANRRLDAALGDPSHGLPADALEAARAALGEMDGVLGILEVGRRSRSVDAELSAWVEERIRARAHARADRDWSEADRIRDELTAAGVVLEDSATGTRWKKLSEEG
ncbi:MAG: cysteine--tRNA ligase [Gemmatimonadales bacterium]|nr:MAG: cysteine--tRNA ligase [Gemmatimonadales bacterium]